MAGWQGQCQTQASHVFVQVININLLYPNPFPADQTVAIINQTAQLIHVADKLPVTPNEVGSCSLTHKHCHHNKHGAHVFLRARVRPLTDLVAHVHIWPCICVSGPRTLACNSVKSSRTSQLHELACVAGVYASLRDSGYTDGPPAHRTRLDGQASLL